MVKIINIKLKEHLLKRLSLMGISANALCNSLVEWWLEDYENNVGQLLIIEDLRRRIGKLNAEIAELDSKKSLVEDLQRELTIRKSEYKDSNNKLLLWQLKGVLNKKIVAYQYNIEELTTKQSDIIRDIKELDRHFDLEKHVKEFKKLRDKTMF